MIIKAVLFDLDDTLYGDFDVCDKLGLQAAGHSSRKSRGSHARRTPSAARDLAR